MLYSFVWNRLDAVYFVYCFSLTVQYVDLHIFIKKIKFLKKIISYSILKETILDEKSIILLMFNVKYMCSNEAF